MWQLRVHRLLLSLNLQQTQVLLLVTLRLHSKVLFFLECSLCSNWNNHQVLDVNLDLDSSMYVFEGTNLSDFTKDSTLHVICTWAAFEIFCRIFRATILDRSSLIFNRSSLAILHSKLLQNTRFKLTLKQTLSKPKPRLIVLIMVCQHIQNEVLIYLVPKVLEPNNLPLWQSVTKHITRNKMLKVKTTQLHIVAQNTIQTNYYLSVASVDNIFEWINL